MVDVGVEDHGDGGILPQGLISHPLLQLILRRGARLLGCRSGWLSCWLWLWWARAHLLLPGLRLLLLLHLTSWAHHLTPDHLLTSGLDHLASDHLSLHHALLAHDHPLTPRHHVL